jgi:hypothetical protein
MTSIEPPSGPERAYLDAFRESTAMPDAVRERVWAKLSGGPFGPNGGPGGPTGEAANDAGPLLSAASGGGRTWLSSSGVWVAASVAIVTGAIVLAMQSAEPRVDRAEPAAVAEDRLTPSVPGPPEQPSEAIAPSEASEPSEAIEPPNDAKAIEAAITPPSEQPLAKRSKRARAKPEPAPAIQSSSLADERRLIEQTHAALGRGETDVALSLLHKHTRSFERGVFVEEREALLAIATCTAGRLDEGRAAARTFLADYPHAVLAARVRSSCAIGKN